MGQVLSWPSLATWAVDLMKTMLAYKFSLPTASALCLVNRARLTLHLVGAHMHGIQYGAKSARSGHGAPAICQHALTPQLQPFLAGQLPLPLLTRGLLWCCLMKGLRGSLLAHAITPTTSHSMVSAALHPFPHPVLYWLSSKVVDQPAVGLGKVPKYHLPSST